MTLHQESTKGQGLGKGPVERSSVRERLRTARYEALGKSRVKLESVWNGRENFSDVLETLLGDSGNDRTVGIRELRLSCGAGVDVEIPFLFVFAHLFKLSVELIPDLVVNLLPLTHGHCAGSNQFVEIELSGCLTSHNFSVDMWLGERGLVGFVVPLTAVAIHVDHHIASPGLAEFERKLGCPD